MKIKNQNFLILASCFVCLLFGCLQSSQIEFNSSITPTPTWLVTDGVNAETLIVSPATIAIEGGLPTFTAVFEREEEKKTPTSNSGIAFESGEVRVTSTSMPASTVDNKDMTSTPTPTVGSENLSDGVTLAPDEPDETSPLLSDIPLINESSLYMVFPDTNLIWFPQNDVIVQIEKDIVLSNQPWSPDGEKLASVVKSGKRYSKDQLGVVELMTNNIQILPNVFPFHLDGEKVKFSTPPMWSPNGQFLLYSILEPNEKENSIIIIYDISNQEIVFESEEVPLVNLSGWSFNSSQIAYIWWNDEELISNENTTLSIVNLEQNFAEDRIEFIFDQIGEKASWSPNSNKLTIYTSQIERLTYRSFLTYGYHQIFIFNAETKVFDLVKNISERPSHLGNQSLNSYFANSNPWSRDGEKIIYSDRGVICQYILNLDTEECLDEANSIVQDLGALGAEYPSWSFSNSFIGFNIRMTQSYCSPFALFNLNTNELFLSNHEDGECSVFGPSWPISQ